MQLDKVVLDKERQRQVGGEELAMLGVDGDVKERTFHIQAEHKVLGFDDRLEYTNFGAENFGTKARPLLNSTLTP